MATTATTTTATGNNSPPSNFSHIRGHRRSGNTIRVTGVTRAAGCRSLLYSVRWLDETAPNGITSKPASRFSRMCRWREQRVCVRNQSISQLMRTTRSLIKTPEHTETARANTVSQTLSRWLFQRCQNTRDRLPSALHCSRSTLSGSRSCSPSLSPTTPHAHTPPQSLLLLRKNFLRRSGTT